MCMQPNVNVYSYQFPWLMSLSRSVPSSIMGGTVWPLKRVSGAFSSQSSSEVAALFAVLSTASVVATVASDRRE